MKKLHRFLILSILFGVFFFGGTISHVTGTPDWNPIGINFLKDNELSYEITESTGLVEFYPIGNVTIQNGGLINLTYTGEFLNWGLLDVFFDIEFIYENRDINATVLNISQGSIGMNLILGFGGFAPNIITSTNWTASDENALAVANAPVSETWPSLNGELEISSKNGIHIYDYDQNPANGTQETYLEYDEETGILQKFKCSFEDYTIAAELNPLFNSVKMGISGNPLSTMVVFSFLAISFIILKRKQT
jgi:hypothetical protein